MTMTPPTDPKCPYSECSRKFPKTRVGRKDFQHHLYMAHDMELMASHKLADETLFGPKQEHEPTICWNCRNGVCASCMGDYCRCKHKPSPEAA